MAAPDYVEHRLSYLSSGSTPARPHLLTSVFTHSDHVTPVWIHQWLQNDAKSLKQHRRGACCFSISSVKFQFQTGQKNSQFWPKLSISGLSFQFGFSNGYEMIHKAWSSIEEVCSYFSRSSIKFKGHMSRKLMIWLQFERLRMITQIWIHGWLCDCTHGFQEHRRGSLLFFFRSSIKFQGQTGKKMIWLQFEHFRMITPIWIHRKLWNDTHSFLEHGRDSLLFYKIIHQISWSHGSKNQRFESDVSKITRPVAAIKSLRFAFLLKSHRSQL